MAAIIQVSEYPVQVSPKAGQRKHRTGAVYKCAALPLDSVVNVIAWNIKAGIHERFGKRHPQFAMV